MTADSLRQEFRRALGDILARVSAFTGNTPPPRSIAVAYSGGLDSSALLCLAQEYAQQEGITLHAFHVHHGLSPNADAWSRHCAAHCASRGIHFEARKVELDELQRSGIEEAARKARYAALGAMCAHHGAAVLLTAHHQDDQAETVLLQLLRGSGVAGLSGMDVANAAPALLGDAALVMGRPLLGASRAQLEAFVAGQGIDHIVDESNADSRHARNALRHQVMPVFAGLFPGFAARFARTAQHAQSAQRLLIALATQDLAGCIEENFIRLGRLRQLDDDRIDNLLRYWFGTRGMRMPSTAWLAEMRSQLFDAKDDAQLCVSHPDGDIRRHRDRVYLVPKRVIDPRQVAPQAFRWEGQAAIAFPRFGGRLHIEQGEPGFPAGWLRAQDLTLHYRSGGERLKVAMNRHTRSLKQLCQSLDIPAWERETMVIVACDGQALYASGIGIDCRHAVAGGTTTVRLRWQAGEA